MALNTDLPRNKATVGSFQPQSKRISQLIASSWLNPNEPNYFVKGKNNGEVNEDTNDDLQAWVKKDTLTAPFYPPTPYIPLSGT